MPNEVDRVAAKIVKEVRPFFQVNQYVDKELLETMVENVTDLTRTEDAGLLRQAYAPAIAQLTKDLQRLPDPKPFRIEDLSIKADTQEPAIKLEAQIRGNKPILVDVDSLGYYIADGKRRMDGSGYQIVDAASGTIKQVCGSNLVFTKFTKVEDGLLVEGVNGGKSLRVTPQKEFTGPVTINIGNIVLYQKGTGKKEKANLTVKVNG
ncbi:MAG: hypothetical protein A3F80_05185 [Candidatus Melainabacteria bacterium RIFCSPLOWO2_12_FULL_35_11]|nr:MAG: hypothetical protein A3F80_05185 [Candidatus Melainabacteria bacterium RIFCSPLOWO2_12_FULL_35_11]